MKIEMHIKVLIIYFMKFHWGNNMVFKDGVYNVFILGLLIVSDVVF